MMFWTCGGFSLSAGGAWRRPRFGRFALGLFLWMHALVLPAEARDRTSVTLICAKTKVVLTCTKFASGICVESVLTFDAGHGPHSVLPAEKIPQDFDAPTIADDISCVSSNKKLAVSVVYSPDCPYAACMYARMYDLQGNSVLVNEDASISDYFGKGATDLTILVDKSLRENQ